MGSKILDHLVENSLWYMIVSLVAFAFFVGTMNQKVNANTERMNTFATNKDLKILIDGQNKTIDLMNQRFDSLEEDIRQLRK